MAKNDNKNLRGRNNFLIDCETKSCSYRMIVQLVHQLTNDLVGRQSSRNEISGERLEITSVCCWKNKRQRFAGNLKSQELNCQNFLSFY
jgi:hypothetical protein